MNIVDFIRERLAEDEQIAQSAIDPERPGMHWCWEDGERDPLQPGVEVEGLDTQAISLRTVEEYPTVVGPLPAFILCQAEARRQGGLWHIARHDPARVLQQCAGLRRIFAEELDSHVHLEGAGQTVDYEEANESTIFRGLASVWAGHPDYLPEWAQG